MDSKELRIGNYVMIPRGRNADSKIHRVTGIVNGGDFVYADDYESSGHDACNVEPIPLTEEILLKCRFEYTKSGMMIEDQLGNFIINVNIWDNSTGRGDLLINHANKVIENDKIYLHQIQNLYFALTGEELDVKF